MKQHILLEKAYTYDNVSKDLVPKGCSYDRKDGLWIVAGSGEVMMLSNNAPKPQTKKCDVETGEDQKGE